ncbi:MAG: polysaccharide deacetylase family protein [Methylocystis sp.]|nr:polysaccharide deacetylase family protein [Methylocystis sp.]
MPEWRNMAIDAAMGFFRASGAHRLAEPYTRGLGAILMFHRVRSRLKQDFEPNRPLEISPQFLDDLLNHLRRRGFDIISLDAALARLREGGGEGRPFVVLTFDDGYRDLVDCALPALERYRAPFTAYVTAGFAAGSARLWWVELEEAIRRLDRLDVIASGRRLLRPTASAAEKARAFAYLYWRLRAGPEDEVLRVALALCAQAGIEPRSLTQALCLDWDGLRKLARHELATIGAHTLTHARLAKLDGAGAEREMRDSRQMIETELGVCARHFCYPVGDPAAAGQREFELAEQLGFASAVTTRKGMIFREHRDHLLALPRLSINGRHQNLGAVDVLLSGAPFALLNRGRKVLAA